MKPQKINPDAPVSEMTVRTELASRILAGMLNHRNPYPENFMIESAIRAADRLIDKLNEDSE